MVYSNPYLRQEMQRDNFLWKNDFQHARKADEIRLTLPETLRREQQKLDKEAESFINAERKKTGALVSDILSRPIYQHAGGAASQIIVTHYATPRLGENTSDPGPLLSLTKRAVNGKRVHKIVDRIRASDPGLLESPKGAAWESSATEAISDVVSRYTFLPTLLDDTRMARLFSKIGLAREDSREEHVQGYGDSTVKRKKVVRHVPSLIAAHVTMTGLELVYAHREGDSQKAWEPKREALVAAFNALITETKASKVRANDLRIKSDSAGNVVLAFNDRDPFAEALAGGITSGDWDNLKFRSKMGVDHRGRAVWISWSGKAGAMIGGVPGAGKTASLIPVLAGMENNAALYVFDGKGGMDLDGIAPICAIYDNSEDVAAPLETLKRLNEIRGKRTRITKAMFNKPNFWHLTEAERRSVDLYPIFVVLDECQRWFKLSKNKDVKKIQEEITEEVETLIRMARSAGIFVIGATQRPSAESIPTDIRDVCSIKLSFAAETDEAVKMTLGNVPSDPLFNPANISGTPGRFVMVADGEGYVLAQAGYMSEDDLIARLKDAKPVPDQIEVTERLLAQIDKGDTSAAPVADNPAPSAATPAPSDEDDTATAPSAQPDTSVSGGDLFDIDDED